MRIARVRVINLYSLKDVEVDLDDVTVLLGANGTGKSSLLRSIRWFFEGGELDVKEISGHDESLTASVEVTFEDLNSADRAAFGAYVVEDRLTLWRSFSVEQKEKLSGRGLAFPPFEEIRGNEGKRERRNTYNLLREGKPELGLPTVSSADAADSAMAVWESEHEAELVESTKSANHLFGFVGHARLSGRFDFVLVPAGTDPSDASADGRGTLLRQLVDRAIGTSDTREARLLELSDQTGAELEKILDEEDTPELERISTAITSDLAELVPGATVALNPSVPQIRIPDYSLQLTVSDGDLDTDLDRQGHGFQRAVLFTLIRQLAVPTDAGDTPGLLLAIEEPELYQHPIQARHFATTLSELPTNAGGSVQVVYATHSEHFVDPTHYERLRRFDKTRQAETWSRTTIESVSVEALSAILDGVVEAQQVELRLRLTLRRQLAEAIFSRAVLLVEGVTDAALFSGVADRSSGLDAMGVSVVPCGSKTNILLPWAILGELGIPAFVVFDGDNTLEERMTREGKNASDIKQAVAANAATNEMLRQKLGIPAAEEAGTQIVEKAAVFPDCLEAELEAWDSFQTTKETVSSELGEWRPKSDDAYRVAAAEASEEPPAAFLSIIESVRRLAHPQDSS